MGFIYVWIGHLLLVVLDRSRNFSLFFNNLQVDVEVLHEWGIFAHSHTS